MEFYRYISHILVHSTLGHLAVNMVLQVSLGVALEIAHGWWRVLSIYLFGILGGILGKLLFVPYSGLCGASAGCYALLLAHIANVMMVSPNCKFNPKTKMFSLILLELERHGVWSSTTVHLCFVQCHGYNYGVLLVFFNRK